MRIMVTGGAGFMGSHILDGYIAAGHELAIVDSLWSHGGGRRENAEARATLFEAEAPIEYLPRRPGDVRDAQFDSSLAKRELHWQPATTLVEGMRATYDYFRNLRPA